jgi:hypothetical protein
MKIKAVFGGMVVAGMSLFSTATAADLFNGRKPVEFTRNSALAVGTTIAGYPIFKGDGSWKVQDVRANESNGLNGANASSLGQVALEQIEPDGHWFASQSVMVSTQPSGGSTYAMGSPCGGSHLFTSNRASGLDDNCLTIDVRNFQAGSRWLTYFDVRVVQTRSGARRYLMGLQLNAELLGFRETTPSDWNAPDALRSSPSRTAFVERLKPWALSLQVATDKVLDYAKPQNVFDSIPSYRTLMLVPADLADGN